MVTTALIEQGETLTDRGVSTQHLWIEGHNRRRVPVLVYSPETPGSVQTPLVLLGHGASGRKDEPQMFSIARWLVRREGWTVVAIDGPVHGERLVGDEGAVGQTARTALQHPETYEAMTVDWQRTLDACAELQHIGDRRTGFLSFSMGTLLGVPTVAAEPRIRCAVFAIGGIIGASSSLLGRAASRIDRPVLQVNQTEDEIFSRQDAFRLYDALAGPKRIFFYPGGHTEVPREAMERIREFLRAHLTDDRGESGAPAGAW